MGSREACGVPFSCCKPQQDEVIRNVQCGYDVRKPEYVSEIQIYFEGLLQFEAYQDHDRVKRLKTKMEPPAMGPNIKEIYFT